MSESSTPSKSTSSAKGGPKVWGLLAEYDTPRAVYKACEKTRDAGYLIWDSYTPFPVHGLDKAMGLRQSVLPWFVFVGGMLGATCGFTLQWWASTIAYPIIAQGKPYFPMQAFVPVTFEVGVLFASFSAVLGMLALNGLPRFHHSLFNSPRFARVTDDKFFIAIEACDPKYDAVKTREFLESTGATVVEEVED